MTMASNCLAGHAIKRYLLFAVFLRLGHSDELRLELAQLVFRHGDRGPFNSFPTNTCDESCWPAGYEQLTKEGARQHYNLGSYLHHRYRVLHNLLNESFYDRQQIYVRSSDTDRTLMSVQAQLASLFPPDRFQTFEANLPWQPIPVHTVPKHNDPLLRFFDRTDNICPRFSQIYDELEERADYREMTKKHKKFLVWLKSVTKVDYDFTLDKVDNIQDVLYCQAAHNMTQPSWVNSKVMDVLQELENFAMFSPYRDLDAQRLSVGPLVGLILSRINNKVKATHSSDKVYLYSGHDITVAGLLSALSISNGIQPPYASAVFIELYSNPDQKYFVKVFYRNESQSVTTELFDLTPLLPGCSDSPCPFEAFQQLALQVVPSNWTEECQLKRTHKGLKPVAVAGFSIGALIVLALLAVVATLLRIRQGLHKYQPVNSEPDL